jgi:hypothetical protein
MGWILMSEKELDLSVLESLTLADLRADHPADFEFASDTLNCNLKSNLDEYVCKISDEDTKKKSYLFYIPSMKNKWHRHNDQIDYHEFLATNKSASLEIQYLSMELSPCTGSDFVVTKTLQKINNNEAKICQLFGGMPERILQSKQELLIEKGLDIKKELKNQIHQFAPRSIELICEKIGISNIAQLRPGVATYWD